MTRRSGRSVVWDVAVVGAGPAGSVTAALLARAGLHVAVLDKSSQGPPPKVCGEYVSPGCLPILGRLGVLSALRAAGRPLGGMDIHTPGGRFLPARYPQVGAPGEESGLSVTRDRLDGALLDLALASGAVLCAGFQAADLGWSASRVEVRGRSRGGAAQHTARLVVGADGRSSAVARRLGGVRRHPWLDKMALVAYVRGALRQDAVGEIFLGRDCYAILNPVADDVTNVGVVANRRDLPRGQDPRRSLWSMAHGMAGLGGRLRGASLLAPPRCLGPLAYRAASLSGPGVLLVGDAAGFLDPFTGEGIYAALRSAELAATHILSGWTPAGPAPASLAAYARGWERERASKWRLSTWLQRAIRRPWMAEWFVARLVPRPRLASALMATIGDIARTPASRPC